MRCLCGSISGEPHYLGVIDQRRLAVRHRIDGVLDTIAHSGMPFVGCIDYLLHALLGSRDSHAQIVQHGIVSAHDALECARGCDDIRLRGDD